MLAKQLRATIDTQGTEMFTMLQELVVGDENPPIEVISPPTYPPTPAANVVAYTDVQMEMLRIIQKMQQSNTGYSGRSGRDGRGGRHFGGHGGGKRTHRNMDNVSFRRRVTDKEYHTRGDVTNVITIARGKLTDTTTQQRVRMILAGRILLARF